MGELIDVAKQQSRESNEAEQNLFDRLDRRTRELHHLVAKKRSEETRPPVWPAMPDPIDPDGPTGWRHRSDDRYLKDSKDEGIVRAIRSTDSFESELRRRYPEKLEGSGEIRFGDMCRAMVNGPKNDIERRALSERTDSVGGFTVPTFLSPQLIDRLRAKATIFKAGTQRFL